MLKHVQEHFLGLELPSQEESRLLPGLFDARQMKVVDVGSSADDADALDQLDRQLQGRQSNLELCRIQQAAVNTMPWKQVKFVS